MTQQAKLRELIDPDSNYYTLSVSKVRETLIETDPKEFISFLRQCVDQYDYELFSIIFYYLMLFRDIPKIQAFMNHELMDSDILERVIIFAYSKTALSDNDSVEDMLDNVFFFLEQGKLLDILLHSKRIKNNVYLSFHIITKLENEFLERFFSVADFGDQLLARFTAMPDALSRAILVRNPEVFDFILLHLQLLEDQNVTAKFIKKFQNEMIEIRKVNQLIQLNKNKDFKSALQEKGKTRLLFLVDQIKEMNDFYKIIGMLDQKGVFLHDKEKKLLTEILSNPVYKSFLEKKPL